MEENLQSTREHRAVKWTAKRLSAVKLHQRPRPVQSASPRDDVDYRVPGSGTGYWIENLCAEGSVAATVVAVLIVTASWCMSNGLVGNSRSAPEPSRLHTPMVLYL